MMNLDITKIVWGIIAIVIATQMGIHHIAIKNIADAFRLALPN